MHTKKNIWNSYWDYTSIREVFEWKRVKEYILNNLTPAPYPYTTHFVETIRGSWIRPLICEHCVDNIKLIQAVMLSIWWVLDPSTLKKNLFCEVHEEECVYCETSYPTSKEKTITLKEERKNLYRQRNCRSFFSLTSFKRGTHIRCEVCGSFCFRVKKPKTRLQSYSLLGLKNFQIEQILYIELRNTSQNIDSLIYHLDQICPHIISPLLDRYDQDGWLTYPELD